jgi:hypothetical protein
LQQPSGCNYPAHVQDLKLTGVNDLEGVIIISSITSYLRTPFLVVAETNSSKMP